MNMSTAQGQSGIGLLEETIGAISREQSPLTVHAKRWWNTPLVEGGVTPS